MLCVPVRQDPLCLLALRENPLWKLSVDVTEFQAAQLRELWERQLQHALYPCSVILPVDSDLHSSTPMFAKPVLQLHASLIAVRP